MQANIADFLIRSGGEYPKQTALIFEDKRTDFETLNVRVNQLANAFKQDGIRKGDHIGTFSTSSPQQIEILFAVAKIGAVFVPLNYRFKRDEAIGVIDDSRITYLFIEDQYGELIEGIKPGLKNVRRYICIERGLPGFTSYEEFLQTGSQEEPQINTVGEDLAMILYTSGTSGFPKGVMYTHGHLINRIESRKKSLSFLAPGAVIVLVVPTYHTGGIQMILSCISAPLTLVVMRQFRTRQFLEIVEKEQVETCLLVPAMIKRIIDHPDMDRYDLRSLKLITYGTAPISPAVLKKAMEKIKALFVQGYGMTEGSITMLGPTDHALDGDDEEVEKKLKRLDSAGKPMDDVEVRIVDSHDRHLPAGQTGQVIARGPGLMTGYWKAPGETEKLIKDGWLYTGDMGYLDEDGYLFLVGRDKDIIVRGGENISPKEIENVLDTHPKVAESAVIGCADEEWGETVRAIVLPRKGMKITEDELIEYCRERMASYKKPTSVIFVESLPRNPVGKIMKRTLREQFGRE
jgi:long-chain acyl-CoA synthetase